MSLSYRSLFPSRVKIAYSKGWQQAQLRYEKAVRRAQFLKEQEKDNWILLGYQMNTDELFQATELILAEDLKHLRIRNQLSSLKPTIS